MRKTRSRNNKSLINNKYRQNKRRRYIGGMVENTTKNIDNVALLIPVHPKHYTLMCNLLNKLKDNNITIDTYCIFSNRDEYNSFEMRDRIKEIIPENVPNDNSAIQFKKMYGLKVMINTKYDYIITCDCETDIVPENFTKDNINKKITDIYLNKKLYGVNMPHFKDIMSACASVYSGEDYQKIVNATNNLTLYTFFYDIPVYKREDISAFLDKIKYDTLKLTWHHFDTLMYNYYLVVTQNFNIVDVSQLGRDDGNGIYTETTENFNKLKATGFGFGAAGSKFWKLMKYKLLEEKTFILVNMDRD